MPQQQRFSNTDPSVYQLSLVLMERGLAKSSVDAMTLAQGISGEWNPSRYGSEKIRNPYASQQKQPAGGIANVDPREIGTPVRYMNRENHRPGHIENLSYLDDKPFEAVKSAPPRPVQQPPAEASHEDISIPDVTVNEAAPFEESAADDPAVQELLDEDAKEIYADPAPEPVAVPVPVRQEEPIIRPVKKIEFAPVQQRAPVKPTVSDKSEVPVTEEMRAMRGKGLSVEEEQLTDIQKIFYCGGRY